MCGLKQLLDKATLKKAFFAKQLNEAGKNSRAAWRVLHDFIGKVSNKRGSSRRTFSHNGRIVTKSSKIAESFCDFFTGIGPRLASGVRSPSSGSFVDYLGPRSVSSAFFRPTTPGEIESVCLSLDCSKSAGHDGFSPAILQLVSSEVSGLLSRLVNACLGAGHFPDFLKVARVTLIYKDGDPHSWGFIILFLCYLLSQSFLKE